MATDSFTGANGTELTTHNPSWVLGNALNSSFFLENNSLTTVFNYGVSLTAYYTGTFDANQYAEAKVTQTGSLTHYLGVCVRANNGTAYGFNVDGTNYELWKLINYGTYTQLSSGALALSVNDVIRLEVSGTTLTAKRNGSTVATVTDASIASGAPGVCAQPLALSGTQTRIDDWVGDALGAVSITDVDGDNVILSNQNNVVVTGTGFGASQGSGSVTLRQGTTVVTQSIDSWAATSIQFDTAILQVGADIKHGSAALRVTENAGLNNEITITVNPPTGQLYVDLTSVASPSSERITASPDLVAGDQLWIRGDGDVAAPTGLVVNADATFYFTPGNPPATFEVRVWDSSDATWGDWSSFSFLSGNVGTTALGTVTVDPATIIALTGLEAVSYLANVFPGLDVTVTGNGMLASVGNVSVGGDTVVNVQGVSATGVATRLTIWSTIISAQPGTNWVVIIT